MIGRIREALDMLRGEASDCVPFSGMENVARAERRYEEISEALQRLDKSLFLAHTMAAMRPCPDAVMEHRFQSMAEASLQCAAGLRKDAAKNMAAVYVALGEHHLRRSDPEQCLTVWHRALALDSQSRLLRDKIAEVLDQLP
ncbi:hypothetical protein GM415_04195 [Pseudodesulfovibrio cashew]|uniref:Tetratricopeptide repeat protein n=1 Tax=Pseudodesulfovibrio cashew TaxID=2678688 RepID=A0A6I6JG25_9BACT|nr:hypothetical protein [Pseudodesulfovibrio cashew]QGY39352.1 hypothetical protein GM415_04195 [Pseudodesulfovibrio cashew]